MHPILVDFGPRAIGSYGLMVALGLAATSLVVLASVHRARGDVGASAAVLAITVAGGLAGAWLTFGAVEWARTGTLDAVRAGGGLVFFGAVPGAALACFAAGRALRVDILAALDRSIPGLAAGHALGRIGCFLGGCCYGTPFDGPWAVVYTDPIALAAHPPVPRHPTPLYEAAGLLAIGLAFALVPPRRVGDGRRTLAYFVVYAILRLATELVRGDAIRGVWHGVSTSQLVAGFVLVTALPLLARHRARAALVGSS